MLDVGCCVLQKSREKAELFPKLYPPFGSVGVIDHISPGGYSVQWKREGFKSTMYIYTKDDLLCIGKPNQYGYRYNLNQPVVSGYYQRYLEKHQLHRCFPLSDQQRFEFERGMDKLLLMGKVSPEEVFK